MITIQETIEYLRILQNQSKDKKDLKMYRSFITLLEGLQRKSLTRSQVDTIHMKLSDLKINAQVGNQRKHMRKSFRKFIVFLQKSFAFITKGYYTGMYMSLGVSFGLSIGIGLGIPFGMPMGLIYGMIIGMMIGMFIGLILGNLKDAIAEKEDRILSM